MKKNTSIFLELLIFLLIGAAAWFLSRFYLYPLLGLSENAPSPFVTVIMVLMVFFLIKRKKETLSDLGLKKPGSVGKTFLLIFGFLIAKVVILTPIADITIDILNVSKANTSFFSFIHGNVIGYLLWLAVAWTIAAFGEEIVFRGYLLKRIVQVIDHRIGGLIVALIGQAILFGLGHSYVGMAGIISGTVSALGLGALYLLSGQNLWPVIISHGIWDSLGLTLIYLNGAPST